MKTPHFKFMWKSAMEAGRLEAVLCIGYLIGTFLMGLKVNAQWEIVISFQLIVFFLAFLANRYIEFLVFKREI